MKTIAVVPVKALSDAKSRLADALSSEQRVALTLEMLRHVLDVITRSGVVEVVAVVGPDAEGLDLPPDVVYVTQAIEGLNHAIGQGKVWAIEQGADALLVVLADLPLLTPDDIAQIVELGREPNMVVLAPDRHNTGTNIMLAHPASLARFAFGVESYPKHVKLHQAAGAKVEIYTSLGTSLDMDTEEDLLLLKNGSLEALSWMFHRRSHESNEQREWFIVHTYAGYEEKVKKELERRITTLNMSHNIFHVAVPTVKRTALKSGSGQPQWVERKVFPGYVLVEMLDNKESLNVVQNTPGVTSIEKLNLNNRGKA